MTSGAPRGSAADGVASRGAEPTTPNRDSWEAQVRAVRERLVREGVAAGHDELAVGELVDRAAAPYRDARIRSFIGILVERAVREQLSLPVR
jgi:hypothetical protein